MTEEQDGLVKKLVIREIDRLESICKRIEDEIKFDEDVVLRKRKVLESNLKVIATLKELLSKNESTTN